MSLWTPSGEHRIPDEPRPTSATDGAPDAANPGGSPDPDGRERPGPGPEDTAAAQFDELRRQLADAPAEIVVANHCYGLFELAAVYLSQQPPLMEPARLAIDALGYLVDGLGERLGEAHSPLQDALAQIRLAYVQIDASAQGVKD
jgi:hypothetical protein